MWFPFRRQKTVEVTQLADQLMRALELLAAEHQERDAREGIVLLADTLMDRLEHFAPEMREGIAPTLISRLCPVCAARRQRRAEMMRCWRAKRSPVNPLAEAPEGLLPEAPARARK
jgi:hypothetical protein